jgi:transcriptional regulator with PAS, ATPase and Fis domain
MFRLPSNKGHELADTLMKQFNSGALKSPEDIHRVLKTSLIDTKLGGFVTQDPAMIETKKRARLVSSSDHPVLITGPTGTGKEILAEAISSTRPGPFLSVNCGGMPESLVHSIFFGHKAGAYTGAIDNQDGVLRAAKGGTVFLDELGVMPQSLQPLFLRAIQERKVTPVGDTQSYPINCRFIGATSRNLEQMVERGEFLEDLYYRLFTFTLNTTSLEDRVEDIDHIAKIVFDHHEPVDPLAYTTGPRIFRSNVRGIAAYCRRMELFGDWK